MYDYVTRTSTNQGILQSTGFVNKENINKSGVWSLGLLQMDFFYRRKEWYAGQFVRKIIPKKPIPENCISFFTAVLNKQKPKLLSVLVRHVDSTFENIVIQLPVKNAQIDYEFIGEFITGLEQARIAELEAYLLATGLNDYILTEEEQKALNDFETGKIVFGDFFYKNLFNKIIQGRRLTKSDQISGDIPFVMAGTTNTGIANYVSNPVARFPDNSITVDIFGNTFYRGYSFGAGDDTGVYWNDKKEYSSKVMLFLATAMGTSIKGRFSFGEKLRSSRSLCFKMKLPILNNKPDFSVMDVFISAIQKLVIKDVVLYTDAKV